ncbi:cortexin domain-containing 1 protein isoform X2 [Rhinolophus sinicus]|uniref:cortexin domain-containing 1 protein isoform X2 n=1 Tax=Rhinolophus sinicus TaxID=89399 RepID=UPI003D791A66
MPGRLPLRSEPPLGGWPGHARTAGALTQPQPGRCPPSRAWQTLAAPRPQDAPPATPSEQRGSQPGPRAQGTGLPSPVVPALLSWLPAAMSSQCPSLVQRADPGCQPIQWP